MPSDCIDVAITSPPYWGQRKYVGGGIGQEKNPEEFVDNLLEITAEVRRVLKPEGSFWLNLGDTYRGKAQVGVPWRVAIAMMDRQGWVMRNDVVWSKLKGGGSTKDRLRSSHEFVFHFVKNKSSYYYDASSIRLTPRSAKVVDGAVVSATGVSGVRYRRRIELSTSLTDQEKASALAALDDTLNQVAEGVIADFRMVIRGSGHRVTHSNSESLSGRAKELALRGYYFLRYHPDGAMPSDVWEIVPEDTQKRDQRHYASYPTELCLTPIAATCPPGGIVLDPFVGTGSTLVAARQLGRRGLGIDISEEYVDLSVERLVNG